MERRHCRLVKIVGEVVEHFNKNKISEILLHELCDAYYSIVPETPERKCQTCEKFWKGEDHFRSPCIKYYGDIYKTEREKCINNNFEEWKPRSEHMY